MASMEAAATYGEDKKFVDAWHKAGMRNYWTDEMASMGKTLVTTFPVTTKTPTAPADSKKTDSRDLRTEQRPKHQGDSGFKNGRGGKRYETGRRHDGFDQSDGYHQGDHRDGRHQTDQRDGRAGDQRQRFGTGR